MFSTKFISTMNSSLCRLLLVSKTESIFIQGIKTSCPLSQGSSAVPNLFFNDEVQKLLKNITRMDLSIVFRSRKLGGKLEPPEYKFMTSKEVDKAFEGILKKAELKLQMPPVVPIRDETNQVLSKDPELTGYGNCKLVFTDISFDKKERNRMMVVREENGILRKASWEERSRIHQIYFPMPGRQIRVPKMFEESNLKPILDRGDYEFVLDRACAQFEPDDPIYHRVVKETYKHIDTSQAYNTLRSTRHFGPLVYFLISEKNIDNLLLENLQTDRLEDACWLISLYHIVHPTAKSKGKSYQDDEVSFIKAYIENDSNKSSVLNLALRAYSDVKNTQSN